MDRDIVMNGGGNIILAEGHSRRFWTFWRAIAAGILGGCLILLLLLVWLLSRPLPLPEGTLFYAVATRDEIVALPKSVREALPEDWKSYLEQPSAWPYVFGVYREGQTLFSFVVSPRWRAPITEKIHQSTRGLALFAADTEVPGTNGRSYWSFLVERWYAGGLALGTRPYEALGYVNGHNMDWIRFHIDALLLRSTLAAPQAPVGPINEADVALRLSSESADYLKNHFENQSFVPAPDRLARLPGLSGVDLTFGEPGIPALTRLEFQRDLTEQEAGVLLGAYGFTIRRPIVLPDGTVSFERLEPTATSGTSLLGPRKDEIGRIANISGSTFELFQNEEVAEPASAPACSSSPAWMRLSADTVSLIANRFGLHVSPENVRPVQIISDKGVLAGCFE
jgi:hypothetical protein